MRWWLLLFALSLVVAFYLRIQTINEPHTIEYDTEYMLKVARQIVETGSIPEKEPLRYAGYFEDGWDNREVLPLTPMTIALLSFGRPELVKQAAMWYPVLFGMLTIVMVAWVGKELFGEPGLIAGALLGVAPGFLFRTMAGFCDKEPVAMFLVSLGIYLFLVAFKKESWNISLLSGGVFGLAALGWGGYYLFFLPIAIFCVISEFLSDDWTWACVPCLVFLLVDFSINGFYILTSFYGMIFVGSALFVMFNKIIGPSLFYSSFGQAFYAWSMWSRKYEIPLGLGISRKAVLSLFVCGCIAFLGLYVSGTDPLLLMASFVRYLQDPFRGGVHARSVAEQIAPEWGVWGAELGSLKLAFPFTYVVDPMSGLFFLMLASVPCTIFIAYLLKWRWEYIFVSVFAFVFNFIAASSVRTFFPFMPSACLVVAGVLAYLINHESKVTQQVGCLIPIFFILSLLPMAFMNARNIHTAMDPQWFQSLRWYEANTQELSALATWWDYGYWIFNQANRPSLADGSNVYYTPDVDLGVMFTERNETVARDYLLDKGARHVTMDGSLLSKFYWVSSIGRGEENATSFSFYIYSGDAVTDFGPTRFYGTPQSGQIVVTNASVLVGTNGRFLPVELVGSSEGYFAQVQNYSVPHVSGAVVIGGDYALYVPPNAVDYMFTRWFLLDGAGMQYFKKVFDNGYVKTFEVV